MRLKDQMAIVTAGARGIGKLAVFLSSADAQNITGQAISVDGGITLRVGVP